MGEHLLLEEEERRRWLEAPGAVVVLCGGVEVSEGRGGGGGGIGVGFVLLPGRGGGGGGMGSSSVVPVPFSGAGAGAASAGSSKSTEPCRKNAVVLLSNHIKMSKAEQVFQSFLHGVEHGRVLLQL